ncbi:hypothetical protein N8T08_004704 [Aspergillus melleus]|uniref:Uncharacterized protein n=1 Tax=Aspergillus melleus TaxID=138277 RepID=A0ACC3B3T8_9EURO|nr:hypothetical protein N8T08_004704 [Aspergillus melleus]
MAHAVWESYRLELERLYIHENQQLPQVMEYMESKYGFSERKSQYEKYFKRWGLRKNQPLTERRIDKRKREYQKESEVYINGVQYPPNKLKKSRYNKTFVPTVESLPGADSPKTPEGIVVCTPTSSGVQLLWNQSLPWLQFSKLLKPGTNNDLPSLQFTLTTSSESPSTLTSNVNQELMKRLGSIIPWKTLSHPPNISRIVAGLRILMPEESDDEHHILATGLCRNPRTTTESLKLELFLLSNNFISHGPDGKSKESMKIHDSNVMGLFRMSGWNNTKHIEMLLSSREPTTEAIIEKLFASALRLRDLETVKMLLEAGMDPNSRVDTFEQGPLTCLQAAAEMGDDDLGIKIVQLFLSHGADINLSYNGYLPLQYAIESSNHEACSLFLSWNAIPTPSCLVFAATQRNVGLFSEILDRVTDVNARVRLKGKGDEKSALEQAVYGEQLQMIELLLARGADINTRCKVRQNQINISTTVLGIAVLTRNLEIIQLLLQNCADVNPRLHEVFCISPLALAIGCDNTIVRLLLQAGLDIEIADKCGSMSLLEHALKLRNVEMSRFLIEYGARTHKAYSHGQLSSALFLAVQNGYYDIVSFLIQAGAPLNEKYFDGPGTVLAAAIEKGDPKLIHLLESAGARVVGIQLRQIENLETAMYLQASGFLESILKECGGKILTCAIFAQKFDLAQWLLVHNLDVNGGSVEPDERSDEDFPENPLEAAILSKSSSFVEILMTRGAKVTDGHLTAAVKRGEITLLRRILIGFLGSAPTAIASAIMDKKTEALKVMLETGADPRGSPYLDEDWHWVFCLDFPPEDPESVLEIAVLAHNSSILRTLLLSVTWESHLVGRALTMAIVYGHTGIVDDILEQVVDTSQEICIYSDWFDGETKFEQYLNPLQAAAKNQLVPIVQWLVKSSHTDIDYLGEGGRRRTALQHAVNNGNMELIDLLLDHGADVNSAASEDGGATALQIAAIQGFLGIARKLIDLDADVNAAPAILNGRTALEGAAEHGRIDMLGLLLNEGALLVGDYGERQYRRAVELAEKNGQHAAARLVQSWKDRTKESGH